MRILVVIHFFSNAIKHSQAWTFYMIMCNTMLSKDLNWKDSSVGKMFALQPKKKKKKELGVSLRGEMRPSIWAASLLQGTSMHRYLH